MKHLTGAVLVAAVLAVSDVRRNRRGLDVGQERCEEHGCGGEASGASVVREVASQVGDRREVRLPAVRLLRLHGQPPRLRRCDRPPLRDDRVRAPKPSQARLRDDAEPHPDAPVVAGRHHHLDADVDAGAERRDRLLDPVLLGDGAAARSEQLVDRLDRRILPARRSSRREARLVRDVDAELLQEQHAARGRRHRRGGDGREGGTRRRVHVRRCLRDRRRQLGPYAEADERQVPQRALGHRDPQGRQGDEQLRQRRHSQYMRDRDEFATILKSNVPKKYWTSFLGNVPRKGKRTSRTRSARTRRRTAARRISSFRGGRAARPPLTSCMNLLASFDWGDDLGQPRPALRGALADDPGLASSASSGRP